MQIVPNDLGETDEFSLPVEVSPSVIEETKLTRGQRLIRLISSFMVGQGALQGINILAALFLVRHLSIDAYAQFSLSAGFQLVFATLMDMGFASTIIPMVGSRKEDKALVGRLVRSAKHLRDLAFWILAPVTLIAFFAIMHKQHWSWGVQIMLVASVLVALYSGGKVSYFSAPLILYGNLRSYYLPQVISGFGRLIIYFLLDLFGGLNAWIAAGLSALNVTLNGSWLARKSRPLLQWPEREDPATDKELLKYILPSVPAVIFAAFQSQITLFLISTFGGTTLIANVAALSRISQMFSILLTFYVIVVEPHIARRSRNNLAPVFISLIIASILFFVPVVWIAFTWPKIFLWILGPKYQSLGIYIGWVVLSASMNSVAGLMWIMNRSRKWVFWSGSITEIVLVVATQIAFVIFVGAHTIRQAVFLNLATSLCYLVAHGYVSLYGFSQKTASIAESSPT